MSVKKILMLGVVTAFIAPAMTSSLMASATKTMGQLALEQKQKQDAEILAAEQKRVAEEKKAQTAAVQAEHKQVVATVNEPLKDKINQVVDDLNHNLGTKITQAKADDIGSLEAAVDDILKQMPEVYKAGHAQGVVAGHAQGTAEATAAGSKSQADNLNMHLGNIIPNHKLAVIKDDLTNLGTVLTHADNLIGQIPATVFTGVEIKGGAPMDLAGYIEGMRKSLVTLAGGKAANKVAVNKQLNKYNLEIK